MYDDHIYRVTVFFIVHVKLSKQSPRTELDGVTTRDEETFFCGKTVTKKPRKYLLYILISVIRGNFIASEDEDDLFGLKQDKITIEISEKR